MQIIHQREEKKKTGDKHLDATTKKTGDTMAVIRFIFAWANKMLSVTDEWRSAEWKCALESRNRNQCGRSPTWRICIDLHEVTGTISKIAFIQNDDSEVAGCRLDPRRRCWRGGRRASPRQYFVLTSDVFLWITIFCEWVHWRTKKKKIIEENLLRNTDMNQNGK